MPHPDWPAGAPIFALLGGARCYELVYGSTEEALGGAGRKATITPNIITKPTAAKGQGFAARPK